MEADDICQVPPLVQNSDLPACSLIQPAQTLWQMDFSRNGCDSVFHPTALFSHWDFPPAGGGLYSFPMNPSGGVIAAEVMLCVSQGEVTRL